jgi:ribosomal protein L9
MDVILLQRVAKLGQMGDVVSVKQGFARNFLLPQGKALRATAGNMKAFESQKVQLETQNMEAKGEAEAVAAKLDGQQFIVIRSAVRFMGRLPIATQQMLPPMAASPLTKNRSCLIARSRNWVCMT